MHLPVASVLLHCTESHTPAWCDYNLILKIQVLATVSCQAMLYIMPKPEVLCFAKITKFLNPTMYVCIKQTIIYC